MAVAIRGEGGARLAAGLEQRGVRVTSGFFRDGFTQSSYFNQLMAGNGSALHRSSALAAGGRVLVGELQEGIAGVLSSDGAATLVRQAGG